jgi:hypothetical protein
MKQTQDLEDEAQKRKSVAIYFKNNIYDLATKRDLATKHAFKCMVVCFGKNTFLNPRLKFAVK